MSDDLLMLFRILLASLLGAIIGWEREHHGVSAGIRTYAAIALGACVFGILSAHIGSAVGTDPSRIAAQIVTGVGFLGAGIIFRNGDHVNGLTTAATLWATASLGLAIAFGFYAIGILASIIIFFLLLLPRLAWWKKLSVKHYDQHRDA